MKANEAPEKLYLHPNSSHPAGKRHLNLNKVSDHDIEYIRTDAFMEKAVNYLKCNLSGVVAIKKGNTTQGLLRTTSEFIDEFKKFMKGE